jgi:uncharacterized protein
MAEGGSRLRVADERDEIPRIYKRIDMVIDTMLWRRLDVPGHDACQLKQIDNGWQLDGAAVFQEDGLPACLSYQISCEAEWRTQEGIVQGWVGTQTINFHVRQSADGVWILNGQVVPHLNECVDLDLGFTPATNLFQLRRIALQIGQAASVPVAWLDVSAGTLDILHQRYERRTDGTYWYEAPRFNYTAFLEVHPVGFIHQYPGLWEAES